MKQELTTAQCEAAAGKKKKKKKLQKNAAGNNKLETPHPLVVDKDRQI